MKALLTAFALLSFVAASTMPFMASAQETKGDQTTSKPESGMSSEKGATTTPKSSHKAANHKSTKKKTSKKKSHHKSSAKKSKTPETNPAPKQG
jgi:Ni/Co efflux regulator RcnB